MTQSAGDGELTVRARCTVGRMRRAFALLGSMAFMGCSRQGARSSAPTTPTLAQTRPLDEYVPEEEDRPGGPSRRDVAAAMRDVAPAVQACGTGTGGTVSVAVVFLRSGTVAGTFPHPSRPGTSVSECVVRALRAARVPPFVAATFVASYRFALN